VNLRKPDFSNHRRIGATLTPELELRFKGFRVGFKVVFGIINSLFDPNPEELTTENTEGTEGECIAPNRGGLFCPSHHFQKPILLILQLLSSCLKNSFRV
jgi:hypothetical protein